MSDLGSLLTKGLSLGFIYAFSASGFVLMFKTSRIINLAHGQIMTMGAFIFLLLSPLSGNAVVVSLLTVLTGFALIYLVERLFMRPLSPIDLKRGIFMTLGIMLMFKGLIPSLPLSSAVQTPRCLGISSTPIIVLVAGALLVLLFFLFFRFSSLGLYIRAVSDNRKAALALGIPIERLFGFSWIIAGMTALISGILLAICPGTSFSDILSAETKIYPVLVLGGLGSMRGAILGGIMIGILETCAGGQSSGPLKDLLPYLTLILILFIRPYGLLSDKVDLPGIKG